MHQQVLESFHVLLESFQKLHRPVLCTIVLFGKFPKAKFCRMAYNSFHVQTLSFNVLPFLPTHDRPFIQLSLCLQIQKHLDSDMAKKKECMGGTKSNKKSVAPYQKDEKKHKKIAGETNLQLDGRKIWWGFG
jgi:hypothetical protein